MKKNVIALAVAAALAAPMAAQADVKISGQIKVAVSDVEDSTTTQFGPSFDNSFAFSSSEDIGGGMKAMGKLVIDADASGSQKDAYVGIAGGFGTVIAGRMETLAEGKISSMMDDGMSSHGADAQLETAATAIGRVNAVAYVSPNFNGITVAVAGVLDGTDSDMFTHKDMALFYSAGPLAVSAGYTATATGSGLGSDLKQVGASYTMGAAKVSGLYTANADNADTAVRLDYKMGNNSFLVGFKTAEFGGDVTSLKATHSFSKTAAVWAGYRDKADAGNVLHFGMIKKF